MYQISVQMPKPQNQGHERPQFGRKDTKICRIVTKQTGTGRKRKRL